MEEDNIRPPDEAKMMTLLDDTNKNKNKNKNKPNILSDYDRAIKQSLEDFADKDLEQILLQSQEEFELMQQIKEIEEIERLEQEEKERKDFEKNIRAITYETIIPKIKKMEIFDKPNKETYKLLLSVINYYIEGKSIKLTLPDDILNNIFKVLKGIRLTNEELSKIKNLFVI